MTIERSRQQVTTGELVQICASKHCRVILTYFEDSSKHTAALTDIINTLEAETQEEREQLSIHLHHSALPQLAEVGYLEYDQRSGMVRYHGHADLETLATQIDTLHAEEDQ
jgi:hypothetical protein